MLGLMTAADTNTAPENCTCELGRTTGGQMHIYWCAAEPAAPERCTRCGGELLPGPGDAICNPCADRNQTDADAIAAAEECGRMGIHPQHFASLMVLSTADRQLKLQMHTAFTRARNTAGRGRPGGGL